MRATERPNRYLNYRYFMYELRNWRKERSTWRSTWRSRLRRDVLCRQNPGGGALAPTPARFARSLFTARLAVTASPKKPCEEQDA